MTAVSSLALAAATVARSANVGVAAGMAGWAITVLATQARASGALRSPTRSLVAPYLVFAACCGAS